ncbi:L,D-transpeptidase catalytic domain protein (plasmid) [Bosea sp. RAC05]|nr:L,D-transpeptidase catalytic domain protein [Bosea sp. RAC05]
MVGRSVRRLSFMAAMACLWLQPALALDIYAWDGGGPVGSVVINTSERRLYLVVGEGEAHSWPIAVGREGKQWSGRTRVIGKARHPAWRPTASMRAEKPSLPAYVAPGPGNPMGIRAIYLDTGALRIHGTNAPGSIGRAASSGCFRMHNAHVAELYELVDIGAEVIVRR